MSVKFFTNARVELRSRSVFHAYTHTRNCRIPKMGKIRPSQLLLFVVVGLLVGKSITNWKENEINLCPTTSLRNRTTVLTHLNQEDQPFRTELVNLAMSFRSFIPCPEGITRCIREKVRCTPNGLLISTSQCRMLDRMNLGSAMQRKLNVSVMQNDPQLAIIQQIADIQSRNFALLRDKLLLLQCNLETLFSASMMALGPVKPHAVVDQLFSNLQFTAATHLSDDVFRLLDCVEQTVQLRPSLKVTEKTFSARPIVAITSDDTGKDILGQLFSSNIVFRGIRHVAHNVQGSRIFKIGTKYYRYENGSLVDRNAKVTQIKPSLHMDHRTFSPGNHSKDLIELILNIYARTERNVATDYDNILIELSRTAMINEGLRSLSRKFAHDINDDDNPDQYNVLLPLEKVAESISGSMLELFAGITTPVQKFFCSFLLTITIAWIAYFTACFLINLPEHYRTCKAAFRKYVYDPRFPFIRRRNARPHVPVEHNDVAPNLADIPNRPSASNETIVSNELSDPDEQTYSESIRMRDILDQSWELDLARARARQASSLASVAEANNSEAEVDDMSQDTPELPPRPPKSAIATKPRRIKKTLTVTFSPKIKE